MVWVWIGGSQRLHRPTPATPGTHSPPRKDATAGQVSYGSAPCPSGPGTRSSNFHCTARSPPASPWSPAAPGHTRCFLQFRFLRGVPHSTPVPRAAPQEERYPLQGGYRAPDNRSAVCCVGPVWISWSVGRRDAQRRSNRGSRQLPGLLLRPCSPPAPSGSQALSCQLGLCVLRGAPQHTGQWLSDEFIKARLSPSWLGRRLPSWEKPWGSPKFNVTSIFGAAAVCSVLW